MILIDLFRQMGGKPSRHRRMRAIFMQLKGQKLVDIEKIVKEEDKNSVKLIVKYFHVFMWFFRSFAFLPMNVSGPWVKEL